LENWDGWETGRVIVLLSAVLYAGIWVQLSLYHWGGAFRHPAMVTPVIITPVMVVAILLAVVDGDEVLGWIAAGALILGVLEGLAGLVFHLRGTSYMVGGFSIRNFIAGPPPILPVAYSLAGVVGLVGLFLND